MGISESVSDILHGILHTSKVVARWVPVLLIPSHKEQPVGCAQSALDLYHKDKSFRYDNEDMTKIKVCFTYKSVEYYENGIKLLSIDNRT